MPNQPTADELRYGSGAGVHRPPTPREEQLAELGAAMDVVAGGLEAGAVPPVAMAGAVKRVGDPAGGLPLLLGLIVAQLEQLAALAVADHTRAGAILTLWENGRDDELVAEVRRLHADAGALATAVEDLNAQLGEVLR